MPEKSFLDHRLSEYVAEVSPAELPILARLRVETSSHPEAQMQITAQQGQLFQLLVRATAVTRALEVGVFTGYSSLAVALALPENGRLVALDVSEEYTAVARRYWREAGVDRKIELLIAPATQSLDALIAAGEQNRFDFAFVDADKAGYPAYFERCLALVRPGGLLAFDNTLRRATVADPANTETDTVAIRAFNLQIRDDARVQSVLLPIADGLTLAVKL